MTSSCKCLSASNSFYSNISQPVSAKLKHSTGTVKHTIEIFHDLVYEQIKAKQQHYKCFFLH